MQSKYGRTVTYGNADLGEIVRVSYNDNSVYDDVRFTVEARTSMSDIPEDDSRAEELLKQYIAFAQKIIENKKTTDTAVNFCHEKHVDSFFMRYLKGAWTWEVTPTLDDCRRYRNMGVGDCLPMQNDETPLIIEIAEDRREEMIEKCGIGGCRICGEVYLLREDRRAEPYLIREDFAVLCNRKKLDEIKGVGSSFKAEAVSPQDSDDVPNKGAKEEPSAKPSDLITPIKYFGGKGMMWREIVAQFPPPTYKTYVEPFGGSYSVGMHMTYLPPVEVYNDIFKSVYSLYHVLSDAELFKQFQEKVALTPYCEDVFIEARQRLEAPDNAKLTEVERAHLFFVGNRMARQGIGGFNFVCDIRRNLPKCIADYLAAVDGLPEIHNRLSRVLVFNRDGFAIMQQFDGKDAFMYCDPPYEWGTRGTYRYSCDADKDFHKMFVQMCIESESKLLISGYDNEIYHRLEENGFVKVEIPVKMMNGRNEKVTRVECLWRNYELGEAAKPDGGREQMQLF